MRKKEREVTGTAEIGSIIKASDVCRIAFADGNTPYIVTMNFGYQGGDEKKLFFHCATEGRKIEMMKKNNFVCFEMDTGHSIVSGSQACDYTMNYSSVVGYGHLNIVKETEERIKGLNHIMHHYAGSGEFCYRPSSLEKTLILRLDITEMRAKRS